MVGRKPRPEKSNSLALRSAQFVVGAGAAMLDGRVAAAAPMPEYWAVDYNQAAEAAR